MPTLWDNANKMLSPVPATEQAPSLLPWEDGVGCQGSWEGQPLLGQRTRSDTVV